QCAHRFSSAAADPTDHDGTVQNTTPVPATGTSDIDRSGPAPSRPEPLTGPGGRAIRVLVVDDEQTLAELVAMALRYERWEGRTAFDGDAAIAAAHEFRPDVVVLDVMLPGMDGMQALRRIRAEQPDVPVLFLTARDAVEDRI